MWDVRIFDTLLLTLSKLSLLFGWLFERSDRSSEELHCTTLFYLTVMRLQNNQSRHIIFMTSVFFIPFTRVHQVCNIDSFIRRDFKRSAALVNKKIVMPTSVSASFAVSRTRSQLCHCTIAVQVEFWLFGVAVIAVGLLYCSSEQNAIITRRKRERNQLIKEESRRKRTK